MRSGDAGLSPSCTNSLRGLRTATPTASSTETSSSQNLLVQDEMLKIADFGLARTFQVFLFYFFNELHDTCLYASAAILQHQPPFLCRSRLSVYTHEVVTLWYRCPRDHCWVRSDYSPCRRHMELWCHHAGDGNEGHRSSPWRLRD